MICKKCGYDVDKYEVIYRMKGGFDVKGKYYEDWSTVPYCPCGEKIWKIKYALDVNQNHNYHIDIVNYV